MKHFDRNNYLATAKILEGINTVCEQAICPNKYECYASGTATFMLLGDTCTRDCKYCGVTSGKPKQIDEEEPYSIAEAVSKLGISYCVLTCVTRDDLEDGGATVFSNTVKEVKRVNPGCKTEVLISDFGGNWQALNTLLEAKPDVVNHNIEVVAELFPKLRQKGSYTKSLELLRRVKDAGFTTKSGLMVGLGENIEQVYDTLRDLSDAGVDIVTVGQYLRPGRKQVSVARFYEDREFEMIKAVGEKMGMCVVAGPLVRSSYHAKEVAVD